MTLRRPGWLQVAFALAVAATALFGVRLAVSTLHWADPARRDQPIEGWMTPRYVAMSWDLPREVVADALALAPDGTGRRQTLAEIAKARGEDVDVLAARLRAAIDAYRAAPR
jgi:hypothetical protein